MQPDTLFVTDNGGNTSFCEAIVTVWIRSPTPSAKPTVQLDASGNASVTAAA
ncbi:MAG: hypothetical protein IPN44_04895 [Flavobacteriales bacterium]|nr:hypothetical protein [Flavobacteriales bacterium]